MTKYLMAIIEREGDGSFALCPEVDVASQGDTIAEARDKLIEALELSSGTASPAEIMERTHNQIDITHVEVAIG